MNSGSGQSVEKVETPLDLVSPLFLFVWIILGCALTRKTHVSHSIWFHSAFLKMTLLDRGCIAS